MIGQLIGFVKICGVSLGLTMQSTAQIYTLSVLFAAPIFWLASFSRYADATCEKVEVLGMALLISAILFGHWRYWKIGHRFALQHCFGAAFGLFAIGTTLHRMDIFESHLLARKYFSRVNVYYEKKETKKKKNKKRRRKTDILNFNSLHILINKNKKKKKKSCNVACIGSNCFDVAYLACSIRIFRR